MKKKRFLLVEFPVFADYIVHIEITDDIVESGKKYELGNLSKYDDSRAVAIHKNNESFSFIFLRPDHTIGEIAHESWHVIRRMMNYIGAEIEDEIIAYHLEHLVQKIVDWRK